MTRSMVARTLLVAAITSGCAVHFQDTAGVEHLWGIGGMAMREIPPREGVVGVARSITVLGLTAGRRADGAAVGVGWQRWTVLDVARDGAAIDTTPPGGWLGFGYRDAVIVQKAFVKAGDTKRNSIVDFAKELQLVTAATTKDTFLVAIAKAVDTSDADRAKKLGRLASFSTQTPK